MTPEMWETLKSYIFPFIMAILTLALALQNTRKASEEGRKATEEAVKTAIENGQQNALFAQEQFKKVQARADDAHTKFEEANGRIDQLMRRNGELKDELEEEKKRTQEANKRIDQKNIELEEAQKEIRALLSDLEKRIRENSDLKVQVDKLKDEVARLERFKVELTDVRSQIVQLNGQLVTMQTERHALIDAQNDERSRWQTREQELKDHNAALEAKINELIERVKALQAENASLKAEIATWSPTQLPANTLMFEDVKNAAGETVIKTDAEVIPPSGEHVNDDLADKEKPR